MLNVRQHADVLECVLQDVRYAARMLGRSPGFAPLPAADPSLGTGAVGLDSPYYVRRVVSGMQHDARPQAAGLETYPCPDKTNDPDH